MSFWDLAIHIVVLFSLSIPGPVVDVGPDGKVSYEKKEYSK